jgi:alkanesulfonate monooxygenase SsuD/methylene tetrahydromethanopterin reductase-like flavin-dependent oxidoreductase (luciferase family)
MRFGIFYEHQLPRPWEPDSEGRLLANALEQIELADRLGLDYVWEVEHHFLEEYSHSSAPEVFLGAVTQRTRRIRIGHGVVLLPPRFNHPVRVAERVATLDLLSGGRVEFGTGEASSEVELLGFGVDRATKRQEWEEALDAITRMFVETPFAGFEGRHVSIPVRNVVPKPVQRPHPPLWVACSRRETVRMAAARGLGALTFTFLEPSEARAFVDEYHAVLASDECVPAGFAVNPQVAVVTPFLCHRDEATAIERGLDGGHFLGYSLGHYYVHGNHRPGSTNIWDEFLARRSEVGFDRDLAAQQGIDLVMRVVTAVMGSSRGAIGTPEQIRRFLRGYEEAGVDQVIFAGQAGRNRHEHVCESLELFAREVMPEFQERDEAHRRRSAERLAPAVEAALARREPPRTASADFVIPNAAQM